MNQAIINTPTNKHPFQGASKCEFCETITTRIIGIVDSKANLVQGSVIKYFGICDKHLGAIDRIISGEIKIDDFTKEEIQTGSGFNLRSLI
jgi:hypothetical protein